MNAKRLLLVFLSVGLFLTACSTESVTVTPTPVATNPTTPEPVDPESPDTPDCKTTTMQQGIAYTSWAQGEYSLPESKEALANLRATCANWMSLLVTYYQETIDSTDIQALDVTPTDDDLVFAITEAHKLGLKVMLKPHINLSNDIPAHWKGMIGQNFNEKGWEAWFSSYRDFILRYARLAAKYDVEQFSVATELTFAAINREADWRAVVKDIREVYKGDLIYASNHSGEEQQVAWWDAVDFIGVDAYYSLTDKDDPTFEELMAGWAPVVKSLGELSEKFDRPIVLTEIGYRSVDGANKDPWNFHTDPEVDLQEQVDTYSAVFESFYNQPWIGGFYWWDWSPKLDAGGPEDKNYTPYKKPALDVLIKWFK